MPHPWTDSTAAPEKRTRKSSPELSDTVTFEDLRFLAHAQGLCITMAITIPDPTQVQIHLKNAIRDIEKGLSSRGLDASKATELVEPLHSFAVRIEADKAWGVELVLFRSWDILRGFRLSELSGNGAAKEFVVTGDRFQIRPLLPSMSRDQRFYVLALSQKHVRLFLCTFRAVQEIPLVGIAPQNLETWLHNRIPDHVLDNRAKAGPSVGSMQGVMFGTSTDRDRHDEYLTHFFKEIDKGLHKVLAGQNLPLLLAGVEPEIALYRKVNTYPQLLESGVHGSPDGLTHGDLHTRAVEAVKHTFSAPLRKVLRDFKDFRDTNRVSFSIPEILKRAQEGRVADLLIRKDAEYLGTWNGVTMQIKKGPASTQRLSPQAISEQDSDLLNLAALETLSHRGKVFALKRSEMPLESDAAALLRF
ncbi:MAG: hypothetical protein JWO19_3568 [Bryobacterales bacterium]|nr:hypothetical protein [Bryobacterales bacterium]